MEDLRRWTFLTLMLSILLHSCLPQNPIDPTNTYTMDSHATCGKIFQLGANSARVIGKGATQVTSSPTSCTLTLSTDSVREERKFSIEVVDANIYSQGTSFYIYDGQFKDTSAIASFSFGKSPGPNYPKLITSGGFVTFHLEKNTPADFSYSIIINVLVIAGDVPNPDNCVDGVGYGCENYYYNPVITKEQITYIIGGLFGVVIFIIIPLIIIYCYCKQKGVTRRWDEFKLDGQTNTAASIAGSNHSTKATSYKEPWSSQGSRRPYASIRKSPVLSRSRMSQISESDDSVFDEIPKRPAPPPPYEEHDRYDRYTKSNRDDRNSRRERNYRDERYDREDRDRYDQDDRYDREERNGKRGNRHDAPPRKGGKYRYGDAAENSYIQADDDHPQDVFVERVIEPRVKSNAKIKRKHKTEDDEEDDNYDSIDETKKRVLRSDSEPEKTDNETQCQKESDTDESPETESEYESTTEEEEEESEEEEEDAKKALYAKPNKAKETKEKKKSESQPDKVTITKQAAAAPPQAPHIPVSQPVPMMHSGAPVPGMPGVRMMAPGMPMSGFPQQGIPMHQPGIRPVAFVPNPHQNIRPIHPQNQFNPVVAQPNQFQPMSNVFRPPTAIPQQQPPPQQRHPSQSQRLSYNKPQAPQNRPVVNRGDPPVYSYLVQRGYTPLETGRHSPLSTSTGLSQHSDYQGDDSDVPGNLGSGVDLMKRTTNV